LAVGTYTLVTVTGGTINSTTPYTVTGTAIGSGKTASIQVSGGNVNLVVNPSVPCSAANAILGIVDNLNGTFTLTFQGTPKAEYYVVASLDVTAGMGTWTPVLGSTNAAADPSGQWSVIVSNAAPQFYRSVALDPCP